MAKIGLQLGHSGRKGSTKLMWEGIDQPLDDGNWEVISSPLPYQPGVNQVPREMTLADMAQVKAEFVDCARRGDAAGFDLLELHCAHGYLLSSFISPLTNERQDEYGASRTGCATRSRSSRDARGVAVAQADDRPHLGHRLGRGRHRRRRRRADRPGLPGGRRRHRRLHRAGHPRRAPAFGRSYQTPFADAIRNRVGIPTIAVGIISSWDDVNSIVLAGRADLCAVGRAHLYDPNWTLHAAVEQDYDGPGAQWPMPWRAGRRKPQGGRSDGQALAWSGRGRPHPSRQVAPA